MTTLVKICGLSTAETLEAALAAGADMIGLVRYPRSPRHVDLAQGRELSRRAAGRARRVLLVVDADDAALAEAVEALDPDMIQLHGAESPERVRDIRARYGRPVAKAVGIASPDDLAQVARYRGAADRLVLDAKPPRNAAALPGGNGLAFDWALIAGLDRGLPFMLSGGLDANNVGEAIAITGAPAVDVSSGVERAPGQKDPALIEAFVKAVRRTSVAGARKDRVA